MGPADVKELHRTVGRHASRILGTKVGLKSLVVSDWEKAPAGTECEFELLPRDEAQSEIALRGRRRRRVSVVSLFDADNRDWSLADRYWVAWYERWRKDGLTVYSFLTGGWTVFRGIASQEKSQVVRADWDQLCNMVGTQNAGQPHWHLDQPLPVALRAIGEPVSSGLKEYPAVEVGVPGTGIGVTPSVHIDHVHLAMGAWDGKQPNPKCWQRQAGSWPEVCDWAVRTLEYLQMQFKRR